MKRLILITALLAVAIAAPTARASCSQYHCAMGSCPWWEILIDGAFMDPSCGVWSYSAGASRVASGDICTWTNVPYAQLVYNGGISHISQFAQTFPTRNGANDLDNFSFQYIIEIADMTPGDLVKVTVTDTTTGVPITTDTFTADTWCNSVSHSYTSAGWKGHNLQVKWRSTLANTSTTVKVTNVTFWQEATS